MLMKRNVQMSLSAVVKILIVKIIDCVVFVLQVIAKEVIYRAVSGRKKMLK